MDCACHLSLYLPPPFIPLFLSLSLCSVPTDEQGTGRAEERSDIIGVGHIPAEGGGSKGTRKRRRGRSNRKRRRRMSQNFLRVTGSPSPPSSLPTSLLDPWSTQTRLIAAPVNSRKSACSSLQAPLPHHALPLLMCLSPSCPLFPSPSLVHWPPHPTLLFSSSLSTDQRNARATSGTY